MSTQTWVLSGWQHLPSVPEEDEGALRLAVFPTKRHGPEAWMSRCEGRRQTFILRRNHCVAPKQTPKKVAKEKDCAKARKKIQFQSRLSMLPRS